MKLALVDLDGTLVDTKDVNYYAYKEAVEKFGYSIDYDYYSKFCNGKHYLQFLPKVTTNDDRTLMAMHKIKQVAYRKYLSYAKLNVHLVNILRLMKQEYKIALVTTASKQNCDDILELFQLRDLFDLVLTYDDITHSKPDPEGFNKAMAFFDAKPEDTVIFEDSDAGLKAAERSGALYYRTYLMS